MEHNFNRKDGTHKDESRLKGELFEDEILGCLDCHSSFVWKAGEQEFFLRHGLCAPLRCPRCRKARREAREASVQ